MNRESRGWQRWLVRPSSKARRAGAVAIGAALVGALLIPALPASAAGGLEPSGSEQNIPDSGSCGNNGERWVKFTTGGPVADSGTANSGQPKWDATYTSAPNEFTVTGVTDEFGNTVLFNKVVGGAEDDNPVWSFDTAAKSPLLAVPNGGNFSQFAICALPPLGKVTISKSVTGDGAVAGTEFTVNIECKLGDGTVNLADPSTGTITAGGTLTVAAPAGSACTVSEANIPAGYELVSITPSSFTIPEPSSGNTTGNIDVAIVNKVASKQITVTKNTKGGDGTFTFEVKCGDKTFPLEITTKDGSGTGTVTVPSNVTCTVTETNLPDGYSIEGDSTVTVGDTNAVTFTNVGKGSLKISKVQNGGPAGAAFSISYECTDGTKGTVSVKGGDSATVDGILGGSTCSVSESTDLYDVAISDSSVPVSVGGTAVVTVTNTRKTTSLTVNKKTVGGAGEFSFDVKCTGDGGETFTKTVTVAVDTAGGSNSATIDGIPTGLSCTVTEAASADWQVSPAASQDVTAGGEVTFTNTKLEPITVKKFYDANRNGTQDAGEPGISGWQIKVDGTTLTTGADGTATTKVPATGDHTAVEGKATNWFNSTPVSVTLTAPGTATFGNYCIGAGGGLTIGFWSNKNGQALIGADDLTMLRALPLVNANGSAFDPTTAGAVSTWLLNANATNMAYMLSAQLAAAELNVFNGKVSGSALVYAPGVNGADADGFMTVSALIAEAEKTLAADGSTPTGDANRAYQETVKKALDALNNSTSFLQAKPCPTPGSFTF